MSDIRLRGKVIGFEEYEQYTIDDAFGEDSPFRILSCIDAPVSFAVVNPFRIVEDYSFEIEDEVLKELSCGSMEEIVILCIVRPNDRTLFVNMRSPLVINTKAGVFLQIILQNETYGVSVPFVTKKD